MYKALIDEYFNKNKDAMLSDICKIIRIKSDRQEAKEGMPFGEDVVRFLSFTIFEYNTTGLKGTFDCRAPLCANDENLRDVILKI